MHLLINISILFGLAATIYSYVLFTELRRLTGLRVLIAAYAVGLLSFIPSSPLWGTLENLPSLALGVHTLFVALGLGTLIWQLVKERVIQAAYYDLESTLPGRSQWHRIRNETGNQSSAWRVTFSSISTVRKLSSEDTERAFFRLLGDTLYEEQNSLPGFVARVSLRDLGWLIPHSEPDPQVTLEQFIEEQRRACRSGGFEFDFVVAQIS